MTTPSTARKAGPLLGNGSVTTFPFTFKVFAPGDVAVTIANALGVETKLVLNADYSVTLNPNQETSPGGFVTYPLSGSPLPTGSKLSITGDLDYDQPLDLPSGGNFSPLALENQLDRMAMQIQQLREVLNRTLRAPVTSNVDSALPSPDSNALIGWNSAETGLQNFPLSQIATALAFATYRHQTFTGDGVTDTFPLAVDPVTIGNTDVSLDGLVLTPGVDYTLVAGSIVTTVPPGMGAELLVRYGEALPTTAVASIDASFPGYQWIGSTNVEDALKEIVDDLTDTTNPANGATLVGFQRPEAGSVPRTVRGKLLEGMSVDDFATVAQAIAAAITADTVVMVDGPLTVQIPSDAATLQIAIDRLRPRTPRAIITLNIQSGHQPATQVILNAVDASQFIVRSTDPSVTISTAFSGAVLSDSRTPLFGGINQAVLPVIDTKFIFPPSIKGAADGVSVFFGSKALLTSRAGFVRANRALMAAYGSQIVCYQDGDTIEAARVFLPDFQEAADTAMYATFGSSIFVAYAQCQNAGNHGAFAIWESQIDAYRGNFDNAAVHGVYARDNSRINARESNVSSAGTHGYYALHGGQIDARSLGVGSANGCGVNGVFAQHGSWIEAQGISATNCGSTGVLASRGSHINCDDAVVSGSAVGFRAGNGSTINAINGQANNCSIGFNALSSSRISASAGTANNCTSNALLAEQASSIDFEGGSATGAGSVAVLARRASTVNCQSVTATGAVTRGANAAQCSIINAQGANFRKNPASDTAGNNGDFVVFDGGQINKVGGTGGTNVTTNTLSTNGIIFG